MASRSPYDLYTMIAEVVQAREAPWRQDAVCAGTNNKGQGYHFGSSRDGYEDAAKRLCEACPVQRECISEWYNLPPAMQRYGVWGGYTAEELYEIRKGTEGT